MDQGSTPRELIDRARQGLNADAFGALFWHYRRDLTGRFERRLARFPSLRRKQSVEDLVQETAVSAFRGFPRFQGDDPELFHRWLTRIARTVFADAVRHARKKKRDIALEHSRLLNAVQDEAESPVLPIGLEDTANLLGGRREHHPATNASREERHDILQDVLKALSPHYKQVIELRCIQGLSADEAASIMQIDRRYVEVMRLRAMKKLGGLLVNRGFSTASF